MSFAQTYYLDIDSNYRDTSVYPNPTDFTLPFKTNTSTGFFAQGEPLNPQSYFESVSIDPNVSNANISITNGTISNIKIIETQAFVSGVLDPGNTIFKYKNTQIFSLTGLNNSSAFLARFDISSLSVIPYIFNWCVYTDSYTGTTNTTRSIFTFDLLNNIYMEFDAVGYTIDVYYISSISYPLNYYKLEGFNDINHSIFIIYLNPNGNKASYQNHDWGYHRISDKTYDLTSRTENGRFGLNIDDGNNIITNYNSTLNANFLYSRILIFSFSSFSEFNLYNFLSYPYGISEYINYNGTGYVIANINSQFDGLIPGFTVTCPITFSLNTNTGTIFNSSIQMYNYSGISQPTMNFPIVYNGELYTFLSYFNFYGTPDTFAINIMKFTDDCSSGYLISQSSGSYFNGTYYTGGVGSRFRLWCQLINDNVYVITRPEDRYFKTYKYNITTNSMKLIDQLYCTGTQLPYAQVISYQMSGYIYGVSMELTSLYFGSANNLPAFIFKIDPNTDTVSYMSSFNLIYDANWCNLIYQTDTKTYLITTYNSTQIIHFRDLSDPYNPYIINSLLGDDEQIVLTLYNYNLNNNSKRQLLYLNVSTKCYDITDINNIKIFYDSNQIIIGATRLLYIDSTGYGYNTNFIGFSDKQYLEKLPLFNKIENVNTHYNINQQQVIELLENADVMERFNIFSNNYFVISNINSFTIYKTNDITNTFPILTYNINLTGSTGYVYNIKSSYLTDNKVYINVLYDNNTYIYKSDITDELSSNPSFSDFELIYNTNTGGIIDSSITYFNNNLLFVEIRDYNLKLYNNFSLLFNYNESDIDLYSGMTEFFYNTNNNNLYLLFYQNSLSVPITQSICKFYNITDINNIFLNSTTIPIHGTTYKSITYIINGQIFTTRNSNPFDKGINDINSSLTVNVERFFIGLINPYFDSINYDSSVFMISSNVSPTIGSDGIYIVTRKNGVNSILTSGSDIILNGKLKGIALYRTSTQFYFISLLEGKLYIYDLTNLSFSISNQNLSKIETVVEYDPTYSAGYIQKILQNGTVGFTNLIGGNVYEEEISNFCSTSNLDITDNYKNVVVCGSWTNSVSFYYKTSTGSTYKSNLLTYDIETANNSYILNTNIDGINKYVIPLEGPVNNIIQRIQLKGNDTAEFVGYSSSSSFYIYNKQDAGVYINPTVVQKVFNIISDTNAFYISFNLTNGILERDLIVFTNDQSRSIKLYDLNIGPDYTVLVGTSNANTLRVVNNSVLVEQVLYSYIDYNNSQNLFFVTLDTESGAFIGTSLVDVTTNITIDIQDIKQDPDFNRVFIVPRFNLNSGTGTITIYNADGSVALYNNFNGGVPTTPYSLLIQYLYVPLFLDKNGEYYSYVVYRNPPPLYDFNENFSNYNLFLIGNQNDKYLNRNYSIRYNFIEDGLYKIVLNQIIDIGNVIKLLTTVNGITGSQYGYTMNLSKSTQDGYVIYNLNTVPNNENKIISTNIIGYIDTEQFYYFMIPFQSSTGPVNKLIPITNININTGGNYEFTVSDINDLRINLPSGSFYGPYIPFVKPNNKIYSVIPFFGSSIFTPIYYNITLDSITLPNRPIKSLALPGSRSWNDIPFFYVSIYPVDDFGDYDPETVNVVYTNTKLLVLPNPIFKIQTYETSETSNFVTFSSITTPVIKFDKNYTNLAIRVLDPNGDVILFDVSPTKETDFDFPDETLPDSFTNIYLRITLTKR
jgi:hypothetical protein